MPIADIGGAPHAYQLSVPASSQMSGPAVSGLDASETLVFIHGWLLSQAYWQPLVARLVERHRCLTYDLRGFGDSIPVPTVSEEAANRRVQLPLCRDWSPGATSDLDPEQYIASGYSLAAYAQDLRELLDHLGLGQVWLVGHSLGGSVALWAAYLLPERVKGVICVNAGGGIYLPKEFEKFRAAGQQMVKFRPAWLADLPLVPRVFSRAMVHRRLELRWGRQRLRDFVRADRAAAEGALLESTTCEEVHLLPQLVAHLMQPVHFITASQDTVMLPRYVRYLASFHPSFEQEKTVSEIDNCGHMAMLEQPQAVADVISEILATSTRTQASQAS